MEMFGKVFFYLISYYKSSCGSTALLVFLFLYYGNKKRKKNKAENKPWSAMKCREKNRASIDVNENTVILKTKLIRLI
jgi:hypothetical protein